MTWSEFLSLAMRVLIRGLLVFSLTTLGAIISLRAVTSSWISLAPSLGFSILIMTIPFVVIIGMWLVEFVAACITMKQLASGSKQKMLRLYEQLRSGHFDGGWLLTKGVIIRHCIKSDSRNLLAALRVPTDLDNHGLLPVGGFSIGITPTNLLVISDSSLIIIPLPASHRLYTFIDYAEITTLNFLRPWLWLAFFLGPMTNRVIIKTEGKRYKLPLEYEDMRYFQEMIKVKVAIY